MKPASFESGRKRKWVRYEPLGRPGPRVSELCLGARIPDVAEAGGNFVDTANRYAGAHGPSAGPAGNDVGYVQARAAAKRRAASRGRRTKHERVPGSAHRRPKCQCTTLPYATTMTQDRRFPTVPFTEAERDYLTTQPLGRLATVTPDGAPQNTPVSFRHNIEAGTIDIGGLKMGASRKFRNVQADGRVSFIVDDIASLDPWRARGIEIRGQAEALVDQVPHVPSLSNEIIRIHPRRIISWGIDPATEGMHKRNVEPDGRVRS